MPFTITTLPKAELHCHLDGILDPAIARAICEEDPTCPVDVTALENAYPIQSIEKFFEWFKYVVPIESQLRYLGLLAVQHIARLKRQNVRYAEWMLPVGGLGLMGERVVALEHVSILRGWVDTAVGDDLTIAFTIGVGRHKSVDEVEKLTETLLALYEANLIVGIGLAGPEIGNPVRPFTRILARLHEAGMGIEIHAGEWCGPESVWDALEYGYPDRIGHGVSLFQDTKLVTLFQERQIHIEMCPTSNLCTGSIMRLEDHPIGKARELGMNFSINSDDPGAFMCSMNSEYARLVEVFGFDEHDFMRVYQNTLNAKFHKPSIACKATQSNAPIPE
ncbi:MAG: hypothetical protein JXA21_28335 [Anaerolineae bacterium]|nr:hypothetical protein [Anaerolineae bacterium]